MPAAVAHFHLLQVAGTLGEVAKLREVPAGDGLFLCGEGQDREWTVMRGLHEATQRGPEQGRLGGGGQVLGHSTGGSSLC